MSTDLNYSLSSGMSQNCFNLVYLPDIKTILAANSTSECNYIKLYRSKKNYKFRMKHTLLYNDIQKFYFDWKISKLICLERNKIGILFGNQYTNYLLRFYEIETDPAKSIKINEYREFGFCANFKSKILDTIVQEKLLDIKIHSNLEFIFLLFNRSLKIYSTSHKRYFF